MSLRPDDRFGRGRSSSTSGRNRERSRSNVRVPEAPEPPTAVPRNYGYAPPPSGYDRDSPSYEVRSPPGGYPDQKPGYFPLGNGHTSQYGGPSSIHMPALPDDFTMGGYADLPPHECPGYQGPPVRRDDDLAYGDSDHDRPKDRLARHASYNDSSAKYKYTPAANGQYESASKPYEYAQAPEKITYTSKPRAEPERITYTSKPQSEPHDIRYTSTPQGQYHEPLARTYSRHAYEDDPQIVDITPGREKHDRKTSSSKTHRLSVNTEQPSLQPSRSAGLGASLNRLSVSGNRPDPSGFGGHGGLPPPSPLLEAYHGTYQSISPMPFAIRQYDDDDELDMLEPLESTLSRNGHSGTGRDHDQGHDKLAQDSQVKGKKHVLVYDPEKDAKLVAQALNHHRPDADAICDTVPHLSHDQIMELRKEYKKQVKIQGKGVNLTKHILTKLKGTNFGKAVYVTSLGKFESEGYWANFFYQSHGNRRELLIESLMGRTNADIRMIEDEFKDKRYADSLVKCMERELKMDKFRTAILMALEGRRQEEQDVYPQEYVIRDVDMLYKVVREPKGGESTMLKIIVLRSDAHLREVLRVYERMYGENFARTALKRSNNLVGEVLAHILNGVINKPARDALLLQHAVKDIEEKNRDDDLRYELLISRLVRVHWDRMHLARVKKEYYEKYRVNLEDAIERATKGDFGEFMCELCETKT